MTRDKMREEAEIISAFALYALNEMGLCAGWSVLQCVSAKMQIERAVQMYLPTLLSSVKDDGFREGAEVEGTIYELDFESPEYTRVSFRVPVDSSWRVGRYAIRPLPPHAHAEGEAR